jgi:hypothetical protein
MRLDLWRVAVQVSEQKPGRPASVLDRSVSVIAQDRFAQGLLQSFRELCQRR